MSNMQKNDQRSKVKECDYTRGFSINNIKYVFLGNSYIPNHIYCRREDGTLVHVSLNSPIDEEKKCIGSN
jgi:hypothetical protein